MYKAKFIADSGKEYIFGPSGGTAFDMDVGEGLAVDLSTVQGFSQVGGAVEHMSVGGRTITVKGVIFGDIPEGKRKMRNAFAPFVSGTLIFNDSYSIRVYVKSSPAFSPVKNDGKFSMQLYAPVPFFSSLAEKQYYIGAVRPMFRFPVNYAVPHQFGKTMEQRIVNALNEGDAKVPLNMRIEAKGPCANIVVTNLETFEFVKFNGSMDMGDYIRLWRDEFNVLNAELVSDDEITDILSWIDDESTLFELNMGDNLISTTDDNNGANLSITITFNPRAVSVYEA